MNIYDSMLSKLVEEGIMEVDELIALNEEQRKQLALTYMDKSDQAYDAMKEDYEN